MRKKLFLILACAFQVIMLNAQPSRVKNDFNSYFKEQIGDNYLIIHTAAYKDVQRDEIKAYLPEGEYLLLPAPSLSFGKEIEIDISDDLKDVRRTPQGYYSFKASNTKEYNFRADAQLDVESNELLFIIYRKYNPTKKKQLKTLAYVDIDGNRFTFDGTTKKYSVIYFSSRLSAWSYKFVETMNSLSKDFEQVKFLKLSGDSKTSLKEFQEKSNLQGWCLIPYIRANDDLMFNELLSFPAFCIIDNEAKEIVFYHVADYVNIDKLLRKNLKRFLK